MGVEPMKDGFSLRKFQAEDVPFFNKVRNSCSQYLHDKKKYSLEDSLKWFDSTNPDYFLLLYDDKKAGYFRTKTVGGEFFVGLDLAEEFRGKKLAVKAYGYFFSIFVRKDYYIYVDKNNLRAYNLYLKLGFEVQGDEIVNDLPSIKMKLVK
ncbi:MAG: hypothetical protein CMJ25_18935 [Phycisphaerae bacterium]|nr:hypothetical protein [Phycisphaerae bacterium]|tara:strand:- start:54 stop:506 length:453 start_codon:yes stop_codon:yes gene_type:complete